MSWFHSQIKSSFLALLGTHGVTSHSRESRTERIRQALVEELGDFGQVHFPKTMIRIQYAPDAQALWFARSEIMSVLSAKHGETIAQEKIKRISAQFDGLLPKGLIPRSSSLAS